MLKCPKCFNPEAKRLIACDVAKDVVCDTCHPDHSSKGMNLGVVVKDAYGMSQTQAMSIESRIIDKNNKVINRTTGKPVRL